jgi:S1-C subfamily serine protease
MSEDFDDWEVAPEAQPRAGAYDFDLDAALSSVVALEARIPQDAFTAEILGSERAGNGVLIRDDGVILTIGYLITEAEDVTVTTADGRSVAGHVLGYDQASGFGLVQALDPLNAPAIRLGDSRHTVSGEQVVVGGAGGRRRSLAARVVARQEFAGYWEYLIEEAIFTAPGHPNWGGTALIGTSGELLGIGSLQLQHQTSGGAVRPLNMMVPIELLAPVFEDLLTGRSNQRGRPWLGVYAQEMQDAVVIVGFAGEGPARRAGLREGDIVRRVGAMEITNLADFYRSIWAAGPPGSELDVTLEREGDVFDMAVVTGDRNGLLRRRRLH